MAYDTDVEEDQQANVEDAIGEESHHINVEEDRQTEEEGLPAPGPTTRRNVAADEASVLHLLCYLAGPPGMLRRPLF